MGLSVVSLLLYLDTYSYDQCIRIFCYSSNLQQVDQVLIGIRRLHHKVVSHTAKRGSQRATNYSYPPQPRYDFQGSSYDLMPFLVFQQSWRSVSQNIWANTNPRDRTK